MTSNLRNTNKHELENFKSYNLRNNEELPSTKNSTKLYLSNKPKLLIRPRSRQSLIDGVRHRISLKRRKDYALHHRKLLSYCIARYQVGGSEEAEEEKSGDSGPLYSDIFNFDIEDLIEDPIKDYETEAVRRCVGRGLVNFEQCLENVKTSRENNEFCSKHRMIHDLLINRIDYLCQNLKTNNENSQFKNLSLNHYDHVFSTSNQEGNPKQTSKFKTHFWKQMGHRHRIAKANQCRALNLRDPDSICTNVASKDNYYCVMHSDLKELLAKTFDTSPCNVEVYGDPKDDGIPIYIRKYVELFLRLEHMLIFQYELDKMSFTTMENCVSEIFTNATQRWPREGEHFLREQFWPRYPESYLELPLIANFNDILWMMGKLGILNENSDRCKAIWLK